MLSCSSLFKYSVVTYDYEPQIRQAVSATEVLPLHLHFWYPCGQLGAWCALQSLILQLVQDTLLDEGLRVVKELVASQNKDSSTGSDNSYCDPYCNENKVQVTEVATNLVAGVFIVWLRVNILSK